MSDVRDPATDQQLPVEGQWPVYDILIGELRERWHLSADVQELIQQALRSREQLGIRKYGRSLQSHNGRDSWLDCWEDTLDAMAYITQVELEHGPQDYVAGHLLRALEGLALRRLNRERVLGSD